MGFFCRNIFVGAFVVTNLLLSPVAGASGNMDELLETYDAVRAFCGGLSDEISRVSRVSKANTAISAVGTVASGVALGTGIAKARTDKNLDEISNKICEIGGCDPDNIDSMSDEEFANTVLPLLMEAVAADNQDKINQIKELKTAHDAELARSKRLGNWRTGTLAASVGTNVATAILAGLNRNKSDLLQHVAACRAALDELKTAYRAALDAGENPVENETLARVNRTMSNCGVLNESDIEKIEKRIGAVMGTGIAGAAVGAVGMGTSIAANTDAVRNDNSEAGKKKEKTLNTVANVAAGANVAIGAVETGLSISLITTAKKMIQTATLCEDTL